jgi:aspartate/methionine/tyrosine aminotransferase
MKISKFSKKLKGDGRDEILERARELENNGKKIIHLEIGDPHFPTPDHIVDAAVKSLRDGETHYGSKSGNEDFVEAVRQDTYKQLGFLPDCEQIVIAPSSAIIQFAFRILAQPGDEILLPDPGYRAYYSLANLLGIKTVSIPLREENEFRMDPGDVKKLLSKKTKLILINSPNNPTGAVMTKEEAREIAAIAEKHGVYVLSDEVYDKIIYEGGHHSPAVYDWCRERIIIINSLSKSYAMTGWRLGYAIAPVAIAEKLRTWMRYTIFSVPDFIQRAGTAALLGDQKPLERMVAYYKKRRDLLLGGLSELPDIKCVKPNGALYIFPNIRKTGLTSKEFVDFFFKNAGVAISSGTEFGPAGEGYVRLSFAVSEADIVEGLKRIKRAWIKK